MQYDTQELVKQAADAVFRMPAIHAPQIRMRRARIEINETRQAYQLDTQETANDTLQTNIQFALPDILGEIQNKTGLTRRTVFQILKASNRLNDAANNPQRFIDSATEKIKRCLSALMAEGIVYELEEDERYRQQLLVNLKKLECEGEEFFANDHTFAVNKKEKTIAENYIPLDSETEKRFAVDCENYENISLYFKLPRWFKIPTPLGSYNPDWAVVKQNGAKAYFVAETKNTGKGIYEGVDEDMLRDSERQKIKCAKAYFEAISEVEYKVVKSVKELRGT